MLSKHKMKAIELPRANEDAYAAATLRQKTASSTSSIANFKDIRETTSQQCALAIMMLMGQENQDRRTSEKIENPGQNTPKQKQVNTHGNNGR